MVVESGELIDQRYVVRSEIGSGNFGVVYLAEDIQNGAPVALKWLHPEVQKDAALRHRLKREARLIGLLRSPHAVKVFGLNETPDGQLYIVMEYLEGEELAGVIKKQGRMPVARATHIARQTLDVLAEAHLAGVIHRDLKPSNIFICQGGPFPDLVKVFDFGIAKVVNTGGKGVQQTTRLTVAGSILGSPAYMSPEQCRGDDLTAASDLYSLGVILYEAISGHLPFEGPSPAETLMMHATHQPPPLPPDVAGTTLGRAVMQSLEKEPSKRFATAAEFYAAIVGKKAPAATPAKANAPVAKPQPAVVSSRKAAKGGGWMLIAAVLVLVLVVLGILGSQYM